MSTDNYRIHLDRWVKVSNGTFASGVTTWTLPFTDASLDTIVPSETRNDAIEGVAVSVTSNNGTTVTKTGNYSLATCVIGRAFTASFVLSKPLVVGENNTTLIAPRFLVRMLNIFHKRAGSYNVKIGSGFTDATRSFAAGPAGATAASLQVKNNGVFTARLPGNPDTKYWTIDDTSAKPLVITGLEWIGDYGEVCR